MNLSLMRCTATPPCNASAPRCAAADAGTAAEDWAVLLSALRERLTEAPQAVPGVRRLLGADPGLQAVARDCLAALDQLHGELSDERALRQRRESELQDVSTVLAQVQSRLVIARAGTRRARRLALHDDLTSLPNRRYLMAQLHAALGARGPDRRTPALLFIDLDGFKAVNDRHGHAVGDQLLRIVALRLQRAIRAADVVGRLGGDEFACLLLDAPDRQELGRLAGDLYAAVAAPLQVDELELVVRPSIGIATGPAAGTTAAALLRQADIAMYQAKRQGGGLAFFDPGLPDAPARVRQLPHPLPWGVLRG